MNAQTGIIPTDAGAVSNFKNIAQYPPEFIDWNSRLIAIPQNIRNNQGQGITVAVLDSGIDKTHIDLAKNLIDSQNYTNIADTDEDFQGHGTEMASLIAASPFLQGKGISGVAPAASIISTKVLYDRNDPDDFISVANALNYVLKKNSDVINISIARDSTVADVEMIINNIDNAIVFAATDECYPSSSPADLINVFPANCSGVIPVCSLKKDYVVQFWDQLHSPMIIIPSFNAWCCSIHLRNYYFHATGSSVSTAFCSGIAALLLSDIPSLKGNRQGLLDEMSRYASGIQDAFLDPENELRFILR